MAKRRRLTPPQPAFLDPVSSGQPEIETKSMPMAAAPLARAPIAQVAGDSAMTAAVNELTEVLASARADGRLAQVLALDEIDPGHLVRDRVTADTPELEELIASLSARGQRTPIEVVDLGEGTRPRYGLISGWRRWTALNRLAAEDPSFNRVAAVIRVPESAGDAYLSMVEENEIRLGLSFYERARIVVKALDEGVFPEPRVALQTLFANVSRAKRSKIKSFMSVVSALDGDLRFPTALSERLGLALARHLEAPGAAKVLRGRLAKEVSENAEDEIRLLTSVLAIASSTGGAGDATAHEVSANPAEQTPLPSSSAPVEAARAAVYLHATADKVTLTGPGADGAFIDALTDWLKHRGNFRS